MGKIKDYEDLRSKYTELLTTLAKLQQNPKEFADVKINVTGIRGTSTLPLVIAKAQEFIPVVLAAVVEDLKSQLTIAGAEAKVEATELIATIDEENKG